MAEARTERVVLAALYAVCVGGPVVLHHGLPLVLAFVVGTGVSTGLWFSMFPPRTRLPWFGLAVPLFAGIDHLIGTPSAIRVAWGACLALGAAVACTMAERWEPRWSEKACSRAFSLALVSLMAGAFAAVTYKFWIFSDGMLSQDTAYFEQGIWGFVTGRNFFQGSSQGWWRYSPPLESHFSMHFSPVLFPLAGLYALWSSYHLLHLVQVVAVLSAAVPVFLVVRRVDPVAAVLFGVAYALNPAVVYQTQLSFHVLSLAAPAVAWAGYFFLRKRLGPFLACLILACCVREDLALLAAAGGVPALLSRRGRRPLAAWVLLPVVVAVVGGGAAVLTTRTFCHSGNEVIQGLFSHLGDSPRAIVANVVRDPVHFLAYAWDACRVRYLVGLLRPGLFGALLQPLSILAVPVLLVNLLARGAGTASLDMYYSVYIPPVLTTAAVATWLRLEAPLSRVARAPVRSTRLAVAALALVATLMGLPSVFGRQQLAGYVPSSSVDDIRAVVAAIPPDAAVAAPRHVVYALARREELYLVNRWAQYVRYDPEYVAVETDFSDSTLNDGTLESYRDYARALGEDPDFVPVVVRPHLVLYRKREGGGAGATVVPLGRGSGAAGGP